MSLSPQVKRNMIINNTNELPSRLEISILSNQKIPEKSHSHMEL